VGAAGASGAGQGDKRPAEDAREYARRLRSPPIDQVLGDVVVGLLHAAQAKLGRRDARLLTGVTAVAHEHAPLPAGRTHQADRPGAGATAAGSGERGKPREPAGPAGGQRSGPGPGPAAGRCSAVHGAIIRAVGERLGAVHTHFRPRLEGRTR
jgi:hypothetical protein